MRCRRKWNWAYAQGLKTEKYESNLSTGSAVHAALQAYYKGGSPLDALDEYWTPVLEEFEFVPEAASLNKDITLSHIMVEGYLEWLAETAEDAGLTPIGIEEKIEYELIPGEVTLHGTLDLVMTDPNGQLWLFDHKTTNAFGALTDRRMQLNFQLLTYAVLCEEFYGTAPAGATLNMLRKVQRTAAAKPPFYQREKVHFNAHQLAAHRAHMRAILREIQTTEELVAEGNDAAAYPVVDQDCTWKCPFLGVCALADDGSDIQGALNDLYVKRDRSSV